MTKELELRIKLRIEKLKQELKNPNIDEKYKFVLSLKIEELEKLLK